MIESRVTQMLERYLDVTSHRYSLVAGNIANIDTPGYHTRDLDFRSELARYGAETSGESGHSFEVQGLIARPDGNNVSLERESMLLAETQLQFRTGVQLLRSEFKRIQMAINEGRQG